MDHVKNLRERATVGTAANARFCDSASRQLIEDIRTGDDTAFLSAAKTLGEQLIAAMKPLGAAKSGLLVRATFHSDATPPEATSAWLELP